ncbi:uncharacterized protein E0L32_010720 [Thyridium curvatum]|uniref:DUF7770 domain-containing protein n=1 Tax=Thyridium curvatum TaxID=1093900 RepID=A0A507ARV4_9PEZI|nr:uncharacterized protein E0L32_010720 [Thyridium curvatum]TPX07621.1 hypothetical protein E0L32_010720 [Thyridium curvatum]
MVATSSSPRTIEGYEVGEIPAQAAFTTEINIAGLGASVQDVINMQYPDSQAMMKRPGMYIKYLPYQYDETTGQFLTGGAYLFDTWEHAQDYGRWTTDEYEVGEPKTKFWDQPAFESTARLPWKVVGACNFAPVGEHAIGRFTRWKYAGDDAEAALREMYTRLRDASKAQGAVAFWLLHHPQEQRIGVQLAYRGLGENVPLGQSVASARQHQHPVRSFFDAKLATRVEFDRGHNILSYSGSKTLRSSYKPTHWFPEVAWGCLGLARGAYCDWAIALSCWSAGNAVLACLPAQSGSPRLRSIRRVTPDDFRIEVVFLWQICIGTFESHYRTEYLVSSASAYFTTQVLAPSFLMGNCLSSPSDGARKSSGHRVSSHELRSYEPIQYQSDRTEARGLPVQCVHFVAHTLLANGGNHWIMFLQASPGRSVQINMEPSEVRGAPAPGHGYRGVMQVSAREIGVSEDRHQIVTIPTTRGRAVADFIDAIVAAGHHEYDFTTEGRGCTGWMLDQYRLFLQNGLIRSGFDVIERIIGLAWVEGQPISERAVTHGFYMRNTRGGGWSQQARGRSGGNRAN